MGSLAVAMLLGSCGRGSAGTSYPCNGSLCAATGGANSGGASGAGEAGAGGNGGAPDGSGGMVGESGGAAVAVAGNIGTSYPCNGLFRAATGGASSGGASGAGEAGAGGSGSAPDGSGGMVGESGSGGDAGPTCVVGQTYCSKTTLPPFFSLTPNYQGVCESVRTDCASNPTCACLCSQGRCCVGRHFSSCSDDGGLVTAFCDGI